MIYNQLSEYLLKHLAQVQTLMMMSATSEDAGFRSITRKSQITKYIIASLWEVSQALFKKTINSVMCVLILAKPMKKIILASESVQSV